ncbi:MAG: Mfa1 family fimbria major subunit, partial [Prevotella sp.]|nr:Mfa1 family fimbria major subunit [Prevotella sp.]
MKKLLFFGLMATLMLFTACQTDDEVIESSSVTTTLSDPVYLEVGVLPQTRSETTSVGNESYVESSSGTEVGKDYENSIAEILVILTTTSSSSEKEAFRVSITDPVYEGSDIYRTVVSQEDLKPIAGQTVKVYVYCNPTDELKTSAWDADAIYSLSSTDETLWTKNHILMSNARNHSSSIPSDLSTYNTEANPVELGTVQVERDVCRFDINSSTGTRFWFYSTEDLEGVGETPDEFAFDLKDVALINMSNSFYYLHRVANDVNGVADYQNTNLLNAEITSNWVIDTDALEKLSFQGNSLSENFIYHLSDPTSWTWTSIDDILSNETDNLDGNYNIWRYATENTIPSIEAQKHGISTAIVFRGTIHFEFNQYLHQPTSTVYIYDEIYLGEWDDVIDVANNKHFQTQPGIVNACKQAVAFGQENTEALKALGFKTITPDENGDYWVYYYYWNRHNDNNDNNTMGRMEFATVRNNVYKLSINSVKGFGHPDPTSEDIDPDPILPDDPDETDDAVLDVEVEVYPWVVRENSVDLFN